jgi:hypothetical protein
VRLQGTFSAKDPNTVARARELWDAYLAVPEGDAAVLPADFKVTGASRCVDLYLANQPDRFHLEKGGLGASRSLCSFVSCFDALAAIFDIFTFRDLHLGMWILWGPGAGPRGFGF